jgi:hypothetical protein
MLTTQVAEQAEIDLDRLNCLALQIDPEDLVDCLGKIIHGRSDDWSLF